MSKHKPRQAPPRHLPIDPAARPGLLELDRFSEADIDRWSRLSKDLDELQAVLYSGVEPQRQRYHADLIEALRTVPGQPMDFTGWVRMVTWRYADSPLSALGSLMNYGGRFNIGTDVDNAIHRPWPALYIAADQETAYREKFGMEKGEGIDGLTSDEFALTNGSSYAVVRVDGHLDLVFDLTREGSLDAVCRVLSKIKLPPVARTLQKRLKIPGPPVSMIRTPERLLREVLIVNWRALPAQFGIPSVSQILAGLIMDAGYEAIRFPSTKGDGDCVAVFPHCLASNSSFVALADGAPAGVRHVRLDLGSADQLSGWEALPSYLRPGRM
ncbi:MAG: RES domain-containing protein [Rhodanobacter sp.]